MTFAATVAQLLLSSPSDLPQEHREVVIRAIRTWNNSHGRRAAVIFSPTNWEEGSSPEYGVGPQDSLNRQVVDSSDLGLVIFTDRLGTPTKSHESGTVEEIERLHQQGKRVAILRNMAPREPSRDAASPPHSLPTWRASVTRRSTGSTARWRNCWQSSTARSTTSRSASNPRSRPQHLGTGNRTNSRWASGLRGTMSAIRKLTRRGT